MKESDFKIIYKNRKNKANDLHGVEKKRVRKRDYFSIKMHLI